MNRFDEIYREYFSDVFLYLRSISRNEELAEELTQQVFFKALKSLDQFRVDCDVRVWLCQIAKNEFLSYCRKNKRVTLVSFSECENVCDTGGSDARFEEKIEDSADALAIHKILHELEEPYKEVFSLRTFGELSFKQIAEVFGHSESWARVTYHRARLKILEKCKKFNKQGGNE